MPRHVVVDVDFTPLPRDAWNNAPDVRVKRAAERKRAYRAEGRLKTPSGAVKPTLLDKPICALDGEGMNWSDSSHHYTLLAASWPEGKAKIVADSLTFDHCMTFILSLPPDHTYVIFGGNYDHNMMLNTLPYNVAERLLRTGKASYHGYRIKWIERKMFTVRRGAQSRTVYDVLANFQKAFVPVCKAWHVGTDAEIAIVEAMKEKRGSFTDGEAAEIEKYCFLECDLLRELCRKLFDAILATPYKPKAVYGPGALASAAMTKHNVKRYMAPLPEECEVWTHFAYFGGRFDCAVLGWFEDVYQYDIKSAYPDQIRYLPCLAHCHWEHMTYRDFQRDGLPEWGMIQVEWSVPPDSPWPPFPHRDSKGNVFYPSKGEGRYHASEVRAAMEMYPDSIIFIHGWKLVRECEHQPFDFVDHLYKWRQSLEYGQGIVVKLILNSLYGKCAQQVGGRKDKPPTFQCFFWAGAITAGTRAKLLRAIAADPAAIIGLATDSVVALHELTLEVGFELGQWDVKKLAEYAQISNGVYHAVDEDGSEVERSRGFGRSTVNWSHVKRDYAKSRGCGKHVFRTKTRFITIREAHARLDWKGVQCRWIAAPRVLQFWPSRRFPTGFDRERLQMTVGPLEPTTSYQSAPFKLKSASQDVIDARLRFQGYAWQDYA